MNSCLNSIYGMAQIDAIKNVSAMFSYSNGRITFHNVQTTLPLPQNGLQDFVACDAEGKRYFFHLPVAIDNTSSTEVLGNEFVNVISGSYSIDVSYIIDNYRSDVKYHQMKFHFPELDYFLPSINTVVSQKRQYTYKAKENVYYNQQFNFQGKNINLKLRTYANIIKNNMFSLNSISELVLEIEEDVDCDFLVDLYRKIRVLFAFICNRTNLSINSVELVGSYIFPEHVNPISKTKVEERTIPHKSNLYVINKYTEQPEEKKVIEKTIAYGMLAEHFKDLVDLAFSDTISIQSIHPSKKKRNLIDLDQSLSITAAFERYTANLSLPDFLSEERRKLHDDVISKIEALKEAAKGDKKKKKIYEGIIHDLKLAKLSLAEKIEMVFGGYKEETNSSKNPKEWSGLEEILSEHFKSNEIEALAKEANDWRNELAHDKRTYILSEETMKAIRLVEHLNYCIILRTAGYTDKQINAIIKEVLH